MNPCGVATAIENGAYSNLVILDTVVDGKRKPFGEEALIAECSLVNSTVDL